MADCTFVSRQEARDEYVDQYNEDDLYSDLDPTIFRHRYVMHLTDLKLMDQVVQSLESVEGIAKVRADQDISNGFITVRNIASVISIALIAILLIISVFIISNTIKPHHLRPAGRDRHHENGGGYRWLHPLALRV